MLRLRTNALALTFALGAGLNSTAARAQTPPPPAPVPTVPEVDTAYVVYKESRFPLPFGFGFRVPAYNRVDGVVLPWGPYFSFGEGKFDLDPTVTYRSHIGELDPVVKAMVILSPRTDLRLSAGRATFTNDAWIRSDLINSAAALFVGSDARNYFRADRATAELAHERQGRTLRTVFTIGALHENAWITGSPVPASSRPWSLFGRGDTLKMRRANPPVANGHTTSALGGVALAYSLQGVQWNGDMRLEQALDAPRFTGVPAARDGGGFSQLTFGSTATFPTFGTQTFRFRGRAVFTPGDLAPPQRFAYLGGAGSLATVDLLALGGDNLLFVEGEYSVPLKRPLIPFLGPPVLSMRYAAGGAGVGELPELVQNLGVAVGVRLLRAEFHLDPAYRKTPYTHKTAFSIGVSLGL